MSDPIRVLGAGPAGLTAAIVLAKHGLEVNVYERQQKVGHRFHDDLQGLENWTTKGDVLTELAQTGIEINYHCKPFLGGRIYNPTLRALDVNSPKPIFYMVKRGTADDSLDYGLAQQAIEAGVQLVFNKSLPESEVDIVATGPRGVRAIAAGITFQTDHEDHADVIIGGDLAPQGYVYLLVSDGMGTIATVAFSAFKRIHECLEGAIQTYRELLGISIKDPKRWGGYANFSVPSSAIEDRRIYVGEAAGFQDNLFGFGIRSAMISGSLAAKSLIEGVDYDRLWKARLLSIMRTSRANRLVYGGLGTLAYNLLWFALGKTRDPARFLRLLYTWQKVLPSPPWFGRGRSEDELSGPGPNRPALPK